MLKFRVKLDLSDFFSDERKNAFVLINPDWEDVRAIERHVERIFELNDVRLLTDDACLLPSLESLEVVKKDDVLKVICPGGEGAAAGEVKKKKKKKKELTESHSTPNPNPAKKFRSCLEREAPKSPTNFTELSAIDFPNNNQHQLHLNGSEMNGSTFQVGDDSDADVTITNTTGKRKRKRKKASVSVVADSQLELSAIKVAEGHFRFENSDDEQTRDTKVLQFVNFCDSLNDTARVVRAQVVCQPNGGKEDTPNGGVTIEGDVFEINDTCNDKDTKEEVEKPNGINPDSFKLDFASILEHSEPLERRPAVGEVVLFKIFKFDESGQPCLSKYICGRVNSHDEPSDMFSIDVLDGHSETRNTLGKFACSDVEETAEFEVQFCDMLEKRLFDV